VETMPAAGARFGTIDAPLNDSKLMTALQKDFTDWIFRNSEVTARANTKLKVFGGPDVSQAEFEGMRSEPDGARLGNIRRHPPSKKIKLWKIN
jgi:hypothetical protein